VKIETSVFKTLNCDDQFRDKPYYFDSVRNYNTSSIANVYQVKRQKFIDVF